MTGMALDDVRVVDLTEHTAGPFCSRLLADYGADVVKVESPHGGDPSRRMGPFHGDDPNPEKSALFFFLNCNKRGVTLNLQSSTGREILRRLIRGADVLVEGYPPGTLGDLGLAHDTMAETNPRLVTTSVTPFGQYGPYAGYKATEMVLYGMGGAMCNTGVPGREPISYGVPTAVYHAGAVAAAATLGAFFGARYGGTGQHVDVSILECLLSSVDRRMRSLVAYQYSGETGGRDSLSGGYATGYFPCKDGYFVMAASGPFMFPRLVRMMGNPEALADPRFTTAEGLRDPALRDRFETTLLAWAMGHTKAEIVALAQEHNLICAAVNDVAEVAADAHFNARGAFVDVEHPVMGPVRSVGRPFAMSETPWRARRPAPLLGQHNAEVLGELGYTRDEIVRLRQTGVI